jgi:hypothetical protein
MLAASILLYRNRSSTAVGLGPASGPAWATGHAAGIPSKQNHHGGSYYLFKTYQFTIIGNVLGGSLTLWARFVALLLPPPACHAASLGSIAEVPLALFGVRLSGYLSAVAAVRAVRGGVGGSIIVVRTRLLVVATLLSINVLGGSLQDLADMLVGADVPLLGILSSVPGISSLC